MKHFEISITKGRSEKILAGDTDTPGAWWRDHVTNNRIGRVILNGAAHPTRHLISVIEARPSKVVLETEGRREHDAE